MSTDTDSITVRSLLESSTLAVHFAVNGSRYEWRGESYDINSNSWSPVPAPTAGETVHLGFSSMARPTGEAGEAPQYLEVPYTAWSFYSGSTAERSNARSLLRDYPEAFVEVIGDHGTQLLVLPLDGEVDAALLEVLEGLADYPLYDEQDHSELESELATQAWDGFLRFEVRRGVAELLEGDAVDRLDSTDDDELRERFYALALEAPEPYYAESADSVVFPCQDDVVRQLAEHFTR